MNYLEFSSYNTKFSEYRFICSIPIWTPLFFFLLIALVTTSSTMLNINGERKCFDFFFLSYWESIQSFTISTMLFVGIGRCPLSGWSFILFLVFWVLFFCHDVLLDVVKCFLFAYEMNICFLHIILLIWCIP